MATIPKRLHFDIILNSKVYLNSEPEWFLQIFTII